MYFVVKKAESDLIKIIKERRDQFPSGVIHHWTSSNYTELKQFLDLGMYIGVSGCSFRTSEQCQIIKKIPLDRLLIATNSPHSLINDTFAGHKHIESKFGILDEFDEDETKKLGVMNIERNEPQTLIQVLEVVSSLMG